MPYYLLVGDNSNQKFARFCASHGVLSQLVERDRKTGTDNVRTLWVYLSLDRNATAVAKKLHMHRNTVLYHIDKIEKAFDMSLTDPIICNKLVQDFRYYFLTQGFTKDLEFMETPDILNTDKRSIR